LTNRPKGLSRQKEAKSFLQLNPAGSKIGQPAGATDLDFAGDLEICLEMPLGGHRRMCALRIRQLSPEFRWPTCRVPALGVPIPARA
jgi:hypothetical protein